jgi:hypothetical protein
MKYLDGSLLRPATISGRRQTTMTARRKALASLAIGLLAALFPISAAVADDVLQSCALPTGCVDVPVDDDVADAVDGATGATSKTVDKTKETTDKATGGWSEPVTDPVVDEINDTLDLTPTLDPGGAGKGKKKKQRNRQQEGSQAGTGSVVNERAAAAAAYQNSVDALAAREARRALDGRINTAVSFAPPEIPLGERLAQAALEAAKAFTFPAILIGLVVGFVLVQNRIDHKDPKLAFAPVSSEQDYLSFS